MGSFRRFHRYTRTKFSAGALSAAAVLGLLFNPAQVQGSAIVRDDNGQMDVNNGVYNIYAAQVKDNVAMNTFSKFDLDQNNVANMHFHTQNSSGSDAHSLINFVGSKININGTVNAIRNNKIGGNLYFLSQEGLVVGKSGVINAGTFNALTVNSKLSLDDLSSKASSLIKMEDSNVNASGKIEIYGQVNTTDGARLKAGRAVIIGNGTDMAALKSGVVDFSSLVNTNGSAGISDLTATKAADGDIVLGSSYSGDFKNGAIELTAVSSSRNDYDSAGSDFGKDKSGNNAVKAEITVAKNAVVQGYGNVTAAATAKNGAAQQALTSAKDVKTDDLKEEEVLGAMALAKAEISVNGKMQAGYDVAADNYIDGDSSKLTLSATTSNYYASDNNLNAATAAAQKLPGKLYNEITQKLLQSVIGKKDINISYVNLQSTSKINVGEEATVGASGDVSMNAKAALTVSAGGAKGNTTLAGYVKKYNDAIDKAEEEEKKNDNSTEKKEEKEKKSKITFEASAPVVYVDTAATADIEVAGTVESKSGNISAKAESSSTTTTKSSVTAPAAKADKTDKKDSDKDKAADAKDGDEQSKDKSSNLSGLKLGLGLAYADDSANINIKEGAKLTAQQGKISLAADTNTKTDYNVEAQTGKEAYLATSVLYSSLKSKSNVNIAGELTAQTGIDVASTQSATYKTNVSNVVALSDAESKSDDASDSSSDSSGSSGSSQEDAEDADPNDAASAVHDLFELAEREAAQENAAQSGGNVNDTKNWQDLLSLGAGVSAASGEIAADVTIANTGKLTVTGTKSDKTTPGINLTATSGFADVKMDVASGLAMGKDKQGKEKSVAAAVLIANLHNDAKVTIADGDNEHHAVLSAPQITANATADSGYKRGAVVWAPFDKAVKVEDIKKALGNAYDTSKYTNALNNLTSNPSMETLKAFKEVVTGIKKDLTDRKTAVADALKKDLSDIVSSFKKTLNAADYANFVVGTTNTGSADKNLDLAVAGSVNYSNVNANAKVLVGKNAELTASDGNVALGAKSDNSLLSMTGTVSAYKVGEKAASYIPDSVTNVYDKLPESVRKYMEKELKLKDTEAKIVPEMNVSNSDTGIGGSLALSYRDANAAVVAAEGAKITVQKGTAKLNADTHALDISLVFGGVSKGTTGLTGMGSYQGGNINSIVAVDDEAVLNAGKLTLDADTAQYATGIAFGRTTDMSKQALGAAIAITDYDVNTIAGVADNDSDAEDEDKDKDSVGAKTRAALQKVLSADEQKLLGSKENKLATEFTAGDVAINAKSTGNVNTFAVAGTGTSDKKAQDANNQPKAENTIFDKLNLSGAGSLALNLGTATTGAAIEGGKDTTLKLNGDSTGSVSVNAAEDKQIGAYSGAIAMQQLGQNDTSSFDAMLSGAVAVEKMTHNVLADVRNAAVSKYSTLKNTAVKEGTDLAIGLAAGKQAVSNATGLQIVGSGSGLALTNNISTDMTNVQVTNTAMVKNIAQNKDIEVAGGVSPSYGNGTSFGFGVSASVLTVNNNLTATINKSQLTADTLENLAVSKLTQVSGALSVGVVTGSSGTASVEAAVATNNLDNNVKAQVSDSTVDVQELRVRAYDGDLTQLTAQKTEETDTSANTHLDELKSQGVNVDGQENLQALNSSNSGISNTEINKDSLEKTIEDPNYDGSSSSAASSAGNIYSEGTAFADNTKGNKLITFAGSVDVNTASDNFAKGSAAVVVNQIKNTYEAIVDNSTVTAADKTSIDAKSNTFMLSLAAGVGGTGTNGNVVDTADSGSGTTTKNSIKAMLQNSKVTSKDVAVTAKSSDTLINVAGAGGYGNTTTFGVGLLNATNVMDNVTGAYIYGSEITAPTVAVTADNDSNRWAVGAYIKLNKDASVELSGITAVNKGTDDVEAIVDAYTSKDDEGKEQSKNNTFNKVEGITVQATNSTVQKSLAGNITGSHGGTAGVGLALAYNEIGDFTKNRQQQLVARLDNSTINMAQQQGDAQSAAKKITVAASNKDAYSLSLATGVKLGAGSTAQASGNSATTLANTLTQASMTDSSVLDAQKNTALTVQAQSKNNTYTSADMLNANYNSEALSAAVAAGVSVNRITADTKAFVKGTDANNKLSLQLGNTSITADSSQYILNVGVGIDGSYSNANAVSILGNVSVNKLTNNNTAALENVNLQADDNASISVKADDSKTISNYAGAMGFAISGNSVSAAAGVSTAVSTIGGDTDAHVKGSKINAGSLDINANSKNVIRNLAVTAGISGSGASGSFSGAGTVGVTGIGGNTSATMESSDYNKDKGGSGSVSVEAKDDADVLSIIGSPTISLSSKLGAGLGTAADTNLFDRNTKAAIVGDTADKNTIDAWKVSVLADSKQTASSYAVGVSLAAGIAGGVVNGAISVTKTDSQTTAEMSNIKGKIGNVDIDAKHATDIKRFNLSASAAGGKYGGTLGLAVGVVNDSSITKAKLTDNAIERDKDYEVLLDNKAINVNAVNTSSISSKLNSGALTVAIGGNVGGNVAVDNYTNKVGVEVGGNTLGSEKNSYAAFNAKAENNAVYKSAQGEYMLGLANAAAGVGITTASTSVTNTLSGNTIYAENIAATATDNRNYDTSIKNYKGSVFDLGASVLLNYIGSAADSTLSYVYSSDESKQNGEKKSTTVSVDELMEKAQSAVTTQGNYITDNALNGKLSEAGINEKDLNNKVSVKRGDDVQTQGVKVNVENNKLYADSSVKLDAKQNTNVKAVNNQYELSSANMSVAVSNVKVNSDVGVAVKNSTITSTDNNLPVVTITSSNGGDINNTILQGSIGGISICVANASTTLTGQNKIDLDKADIYGASVGIRALDNLNANTVAEGYTYGAIGSGVLFATAQNKTNNTVAITDSKLFANYNSAYEGQKNQNAADGNIAIGADKTNKVEATVNGGVVPGLSGSGWVATAIDGEESETANSQTAQNTITIAGSTLKAKGSINASANKLLGVHATVKGWTGGLSINATGAKSYAYANGASRVNSGEGNSYLADTDVTLKTTVSKQDGADSSISAKMTSNNGGLIGVSVNQAKIYYNVTAETTAQKAVYQAKDLQINALHSVDAANHAEGLEIGAVAASGTMFAETNITANTHVDAKGADYSQNDAYADKYQKDAQGSIVYDENTGKPKLKDDSIYQKDADGNVAYDAETGEPLLTAEAGSKISSIGNTAVQGNTTVNEIVYAKGNGGGIFDISPKAARAVNYLTTDTVTNVTGAWRPVGTFTVDALNKDNINQKVESTKVSVAGGYGGTQNHNIVQHNAQINVGSAAAADKTVILSTGKQLFQAGNDVNHDVYLSSSGGGLISGSGSDMQTTYNGKNTKFTSSVNIDNAALTTDGSNDPDKEDSVIATDRSINAQSYTTGALKYNNKLYAVGVVAEFVGADSVHNISYDNAVNVNGGSTLTTKDKSQDIRLASYDKSTVELNTFAQAGGLSTVVKGSTKSDFSRSSKVTVAKGAKLDSAHDTYLNAGSNLDESQSTLDYKAYATAFAKSLIAFKTAPDITNSMTINNVLTIDGESLSVHNAYLNAATGKSTIGTITKRYTIWSGDDEKKNIITSEPGVENNNETTTSKVLVSDSGKVIAGTKSNLNLLISGDIKEEGGTYSTEDVKVSFGGDDNTKNGSEWFDKDSVEIGSSVIEKNPLYESYSKLVSILSEYSEGSAEYTSIANEIKTLQEEMLKTGFGEYDDNQNFIAKPSRITVGVSVPDINVSGGNVHITANKLEGSGTLQANGVDDITITNNSNVHLFVNNLSIEEAGGRVTLNGSKVGTDNKPATYSGTIIANTGKSNSKIEIASEGKTADNLLKYTSSGVTVNGTLENLNGDIIVSSKFGNVNLASDAKLSGQNIEVIADNGSITQNAKNYINIGSDPLSWYMFESQKSDDQNGIAEKIQRYVAKLIADGKTDAQGNLTDFQFSNYMSYCDYLLAHAAEIKLTEYETNIINQKKNDFIAHYYDHSNGMIANNNIILSARTINVAGTIQSGYNKYTATFTEAMKENIAKLQEKYQDSGNILTDEDVLGNKLFLINGEGEYGAIYDGGSRHYVYGISLYYNPSTGSILCEDINTGGGKVYLQGAINSTDGGEIFAMDGTADVAIDLSGNADNNKLITNNIKINDVKGLISIRDTLTGKITEYTKQDGVTTKFHVADYDQNTGKIGTFSDWTDVSYSSDYDDYIGYYRNAGSRYNWTGGINTSTKVIHYVGTVTVDNFGTVTIDKDNVAESIKNAGGTVTSSDKPVTTKDNVISTGVYSTPFDYETYTSSDFIVKGTQNAEKTYTTVVTAKKDIPASSYDTSSSSYGKVTYTYEWDEVTTSSTTATYSVRGGESIAVGFLRNSSGNINVKNSGDVQLNGTLMNASRTDNAGAVQGIGEIVINSVNGSVTGSGRADAYTDKLTVNAKDDINLTHSALGADALLSLEAQQGNISFDSIAGNVKLAGNGAANGVYNLVAAGNITTDKTVEQVETEIGSIETVETYGEDKVIGKYIKLESRDGGVDVRVAPGVDTASNNNYGYAEGLTVRAEGSIKVYHNEVSHDDSTNTDTAANLNIGVIRSNSGDVTLETAGSIVDIINDNSLSDAGDKLAYWQEMGVIDADDSFDSKDVSAKQDKEKAMADAEAKLEMLTLVKIDAGMQVDEAQKQQYIAAAGEFNTIAASYQAALKEADGDADKVAAAKKVYEQKQAEFFAQDEYKDYSAAVKRVIVNYSETDIYDNYGWSADELLYAVQKDVLNSTPGQTVMGDVANIYGKNITIKAGVGIGVDADAKTIAKADLNKLESLKLLSQCKAGDLTWNDDGSVTIKKQQPILLQLNNDTTEDARADGSVAINAKDNIYISGIKDTELKFNELNIKTEKDIKITSDKGIYGPDADTLGALTLSGHNISLYGGKGGIGTCDNAVRINSMTGVLDVNTAKTDDYGDALKTYLKLGDWQKNEGMGEDIIRLQRVVTGELYINTIASLEWSQEEGKSDSYIDADTITIESNASDGVKIGTEDAPLCILNNDAVVNIIANSVDRKDNSAKDQINLEGVNDGTVSGRLKLLTLIAKGGVNIITDGSLQQVSNPAKFIRRNQIEEFQDNSLNGVISTNSANIRAQGDLLLNSDKNTLKDVIIGSAGGDIKLYNGGSEAFNVGIADVEKKDQTDGLAKSIEIRNVNSGLYNTMTVYGYHQDTSDDSLETGVIHAAGDINLRQDEVIQVDGVIDEETAAKSLYVTSPLHSDNGTISFISNKNITLDTSSIVAEKGSIAIIANAGTLTYVNASTSIKAENGTLLVMAKDGIKGEAAIIEAGGVGFATAGDINFNDKFEINTTLTDDGSIDGSVTLISTGGDINIWNDAQIDAIGNVTLKAGNNIRTGYAGTYEGETNATSGDLGNVISRNGNVTMTADTGAIDNKAKIEAKNGSVSLKSNYKSVYNTGSINAKSVTMDAWESLDTSTGTIIASGTGANDQLELISRTGDVTLNDGSTFLARNNIIVLAEGNIVNNMGADSEGSYAGALYTQDGSIWLNSATGDIQNNKQVSAMNGGNITFTALKGNIENRAKVDTTGKVTMDAAKKLVNTNSSYIVADKGITLLAREGVLTNAGTLQADGTLLEDGSHSADGKITLNSQKNSLLNIGSITGSGDISLRAYKELTNGVMNTTGDIEAKNADITSTGGSVMMQSQTEDISSRGNITAKNNVTMKGYNITKDSKERALYSVGDITAQTGNVLLTTSGFDIKTDGAVKAEQGTVTYDSSRDIDTSGSVSVSAQGDVTLSAGRSITNKANLTSADSAVTLTAQDGIIYTNANITAQDDVNITAAGNISTAGEGNYKIISKQGDVTITSDSGKLENNNTAINATGNISMQASSDVKNHGELSADGNVVLNSADGVIVNSKEVTANGAITFTAANSLTNAGKLQAVEAITLVSQNATKAQADKALYNKGELVSTNNMISLYAGTGNIVNENANISAARSIGIYAQGSVDSIGDLNANSGIVVLAGTGSISSAGELTTANGDITLSAKDNLSLLNSNDRTSTVTAANGIATLHAIDGSVTNQANTQAAMAVILNAGTLVDNYGTLNATAGNVNLKAGTDIENRAAITAAQNAVMEAGGSINNAEKAEVKAEGVIGMTAVANITNNAALTAKEAVVLTADGNITNSGAVTTAEQAKLFADGNLNNSGVINAGNIFLRAGNTKFNGPDAEGHKLGMMTNSAALTAQENLYLVADGDLTNTGTLQAKTGEAVLLSVFDNVYNEAAITSGKEISITANDNVNNTAVLTAGDTVVLSAGAELNNAGNVTADKNINFTAVQKLTNSGALESKNADVELVTKDELDNDGSITAAGSIKLDAAKKLANDGGLTAATGDIDMNSGAELTNTGAAKAGQNLFIKAENDITNSGSLKTGDGRVEITSNRGSIVNNSSDITTNVNNNGDDSLDYSVTMQAYGTVTNNAAITADDEISILAGDDINNNGKLQAEGSQGYINLYSAGGGISNTADIAAYDNVNLEAEKDIVNKGEIFAEGDVTLKTNGSIDNQKEIFATGEVLLDAGGAITNTAKLTTGTKNVKLYADDAITNSGELYAGESIYLDAGTNISNTATMQAYNSIDFDAMAGDITNSGDLTAEYDDVTITAYAGDIENTGTIKAENGWIQLQTISNRKDADGKIVAEGTINNKADLTGGSITLDSYASLEVDKFYGYTYTAKGTDIYDKLEFISRSGDVKLYNNAQFSAAHDIRIIADQSVYNSTNGIKGHDLVAGNDIVITTYNGGIYNNANMKAAGDIDVSSAREIDNTGSVQAGTDAADNVGGNISFVATEQLYQHAGDIKGTQDVYLKSETSRVTLKGNTSSENGDVTITAYKDVDAVASAIEQGMLEITAKKGTASITSQKGDVNTDKVDAYNVYYATESYDHEDETGVSVTNKINAKQTYVADTLGITGNNAYLHSTAIADSNVQDPDNCYADHGIWQTGDNDTLYLTLDTTDKDGEHVPFDELVLNFHKLNGKLDVDKIWVKKLELHAPVDELTIHKLAVAERADISNDKTHSIVYGGKPYPESADAIYWQNYAKHNPGMSEETWASWNDPADTDWMYLILKKDGKTQYSNGVLLHKNDYRYVYSQRYAADDWLLYRTLLEEAELRGDISKIPFYERYNLYDADEEEDAEAKIVVSK